MMKPEIVPAVREKINGLPFSPGVYFMKDAEGTVIYIGKALSLRKRGKSYLNPPPDYPKVSVMMAKVRDIDYIETPTEVDALLLEAQLIRQHSPRYNKELKDDKTFPLIKITSDPYPRVHITRTKTDKKAIYYGPYTDAKLLREAVNLINSLFPIRKCQKLPKSACLYYHIGQCLAPCVLKDIKPQYDKMISEVRTFLGGGKKSFMEYLSERMQQAAGELRFEDAQFYKEQIAALSRLRKKRFSLKDPGSGVGLSATIELKRILEMDKPPEKIVCFDVSNIHGDEAVASRVSFYRELPEKMSYRRYKIRTVQGINDYAMIQEALGRMLRGVKEGSETFVPDVILIDGGKGHLQAAYDVLCREGFSSEGGTASGGGTKLISIAKQFETIYGMISGDTILNSLPAQEIKYRVPGIIDLKVPQHSPALHLLQKIRDEAHRFAITYHRTLKQKQITRSELDLIPGIGEARKRVLLEQFDSMEELKRAGVHQLAGLPGMTLEAAEKVHAYFSGAARDAAPKDQCF